MDPTCGLVERLRDLAFDVILEHLRYLVCYGQNIEQLNERVEELTVERSSIQQRIDEATNNVEQIDVKVLHWLRKADEIFKQVEQLRKEGQAERDCSLTSCPNPWLRYKLSKRAKAMAKQAADICGKAKFDRFSHRLPPFSIPESPIRESNDWIDSRVLIMNEIREALRDPSVNMIGLYGLGGVGKTTIAKEIAKNRMFEKSIMATVSNEVNVESIQGQIAEELGMRLDDVNEKLRARRLRERLKDVKNMLLILDDLWEELVLSEVGIPFLDVENNSKKNEGCKILLTSRDKTLLSDLMKCEKIIEVSILSHDEALNLFNGIAELSVDSSSPELISVAADIVQKCGGLPLLITTLAKALRNKDLNMWKNALARLNHPLRRNITGIKDADVILKWSYDRLSSSEGKHIFLLASMLSHNPSIKDLLMYSMGLDFLGHVENIEEAHVGLSTIVSKLKSSNLFLDNFSSHHVAMHDVIRDVALSIAFSELHAFIVSHKKLNEWPSEHELEDFEGICLQESDISVDLPEELYGPRLKFFMLKSTKLDLTIPKMFFKSSKELKVLTFTKVHFSSLPSLRYLKKLKTFCLHSCLLEDITEIRTLKNLKVLSLAYSEIQRLPIELAELTSLQMLNLSNCSDLKVIPDKLLSSLKKLEVLCMETSFEQWKVEGSSEANENASLDELRDLPISSLDIRIPNVSMLPENLFLLMNLKRYRILIGKRWQWWQCNHENSKILRLKLERGFHLKSGVQKLLEGVEDLHLYGSTGLDNILFSDEGRGFPYLRHLKIENNDDIKCIVLNSTCHETSFPALESLVLQDLTALEKLCEGTNIIDPCLKDGATNDVSDKMFRSLFSKVLLPKLKILKLCNVNNLIPFIWDGQLSHNSLSNLKTLIVKECGFVKLFPLPVLKSLNNLKELEIEKCVMLKTVFDFEDFNDYKEIESSSVVVPLKKLKLQILPKLENLWSSHYQGNVSFPNLRSVDVFCCESLTSIFPASFIVKGMLRNLEELRIFSCGIDVIVANDQASESDTAAFKFPRLTSLKLHGLQKLRNFYPKRHTLEWPNLERLSIEDCGELEIFEKEASGSLEIHMEESTPNSNYPLVLPHQVIHNLRELELEDKDAEMIGSGLFPMYRFPKVKILSLTVQKATISYKSLWKSFPNLEQLKLHGDFETDDVAASFSNLSLSHMSIMTSPSLVSSPNLTHLQVKLCVQLTSLMTSTTARCLVHLTHLHIGYCEMEEIITKQEGENDEDKEIIFNKLKVLKFEEIQGLKRFCGYNYTFRFPLLEQIVMKGCPKFKIFSPGSIDTPSLKSVQLSKNALGTHQEIWDTNLNETFYQQRFVASKEVMLDKYDASMIRNGQFPVKSCPQVEILGIEGFVDDEWLILLERFPGLKELHVEDCSFEEIFPSHASSLASFHNLTELKVVLPKIEILELSNLLNKSVSLIWDEQLLHNSFNNLKTLIVGSCRSLKLVPFHVLKSLNKLEKLQVSGCCMLEMVFGFEDLNDCKDMESASMLVPLNLTNLEVQHCSRLTALMTSSAARSLVHLTHLSISYCDQIKEIITKQEGEDEEDMEIVFDQLEYLELCWLTRLKRFCGHNYTFSFSSLEHTTIRECPQLTMFCSGATHAPLLKKIRVGNLGGPLRDIWMTHLNDTIQHQFTIKEVICTTRSMALNAENITIIKGVFPKVEALYVESFMDEGMTFPYSSLERFPKLDSLYVEHCSFEEIFPSHDHITNDFMEEIPPYKRLCIASLDKLKCIWKDDSQLPLLHQNLIFLEVKSCCNLLKLAPSFASFQYLRQIKVSGCHQLIHLVTSSTAKSLVSLRWLQINDCKNMEEIVMNETNEDVEGGIMFNRLSDIKLTDMPSLKIFSSQSHTFKFPKLEELKIRGCPKMRMFCQGVLKTPKLSKVKIEEHDMSWKDEEDLNEKIQVLSLAKDRVVIEG